jgi:hypothetical protein
MEPLEQPRKQKIGIIFGMWNLRSLYRLDPLITVARKSAKYGLDLVVVQEVRWDKDDNEPAEDYIFFHRRENANCHFGMGFFVHQRIRSVVKRVEIVSDMMSYIVQSGSWHDKIVLNVHAPAEDESDDKKERFYEELGHVFGQLPKYIEILLRLEHKSRKDVSKQTRGNKNLR